MDEASARRFGARPSERQRGLPRRLVLSRSAGRRKSHHGPPNSTWGTISLRPRPCRVADPARKGDGRLAGFHTPGRAAHPVRSTGALSRHCSACPGRGIAGSLQARGRSCALGGAAAHGRGGRQANKLKEEGREVYKKSLGMPHSRALPYLGKAELAPFLARRRGSGWRKRSKDPQCGRVAV